jgi:Mrp family chromosome partitioning ATPase
MFGKKSRSRKLAAERFQNDIAFLSLAVLSAADRTGGSGVISLIGLTEGAGATTLSGELALSLARAGHRVALIDGNRHNNELSEFIGPAPGGDLQALLDGTDSAGIGRTTKVPGLVVVPSRGQQLSESGGSSVQWRARLTALGKERFVIVDAGRIESPSTMIFAAASDGVILVLSCGESKRSQLEAAEARLAGRGVTVLGVALNRRRYYVPDFIFRRL